MKPYLALVALVSIVGMYSCVSRSAGATREHISTIEELVDALHQEQRSAPGGHPQRRHPHPGLRHRQHHGTGLHPRHPLLRGTGLRLARSGIYFARSAYTSRAAARTRLAHSPEPASFFVWFGRGPHAVWTRSHFTPWTRSSTCAFQATQWRNRWTRSTT